MHDEVYEGREQTQVKHYILRHYLERFAHIVGSRWKSITYLDGFAGPWNVRSSELSDSSFSIALDELRKARKTHRARGRDLRLRCCFLEQDREAHVQLERFAAGVKDVQVRVLKGSFEDCVGSIADFIRADRQTFAFLFIDPTGWTGFTLAKISPLFKLKPGEVLINFMTSHIRRFPQNFTDLNSPQFRERVAGLSGLERDDACVTEYMARLKRAGGFSYVLPSIVLQPESDRTHFHLIYATRDLKGVEVFKETEERAMGEMERLREKAQRRRREERTGQWGFVFGGEESPPSHHYSDLRAHYLELSKAAILGLLKQQKRLKYDSVWLHALSNPLVWENDLKSWIKDWKQAGHLRLEGLAERGRVPHRGHSHILVWQGRAS
jgi:three-Cys-motif partner protein